MRKLSVYLIIFCVVIISVLAINLKSFAGMEFTKQQFVARDFNTDTFGYSVVDKYINNKYINVVFERFEPIKTVNDTFIIEPRQYTFSYHVEHYLDCRRNITNTKSVCVQIIKDSFENWRKQNHKEFISELQEQQQQIMNDLTPNDLNINIVE